MRRTAILMFTIILPRVIHSQTACDSNPCLNGATCEPASYDASSYQCITNCPSNYYGQRCEASVPALSVCASCPTDYTQAVPGSCFTISPDPYVFSYADGYCVSIGGRFATIFNDAEDYAIRRLMGDSAAANYSWIGFGDPIDSGFPGWADGNSSSFTRGPPQGSFCYAVTPLGFSGADGNWSREACGESYKAVCRSSCSNATTTTSTSTTSSTTTSTTTSTSTSTTTPTTTSTTTTTSTSTTTPTTTSTTLEPTTSTSTTTLMPTTTTNGDPCYGVTCSNSASCTISQYNASDYECDINCPPNCYGQGCEASVSAAAVCQACPTDYSQNVPGSCFTLMTTAGSWSAGVSNCNALLGNITSINSISEEYELRKLLESLNVPIAWIGYGDPSGEDIFAWADGSTSTYTLWDGGPPLRGYCAAITRLSTGASQKWTTASCSTSYPAICRAPCAPGTTTSTTSSSTTTTATTTTSTTTSTSTSTTSSSTTTTTPTTTTTTTSTSTSPSTSSSTTTTTPTSTTTSTTSPTSTTTSSTTTTTVPTTTSTTTSTSTSTTTPTTTSTTTPTSTSSTSSSTTTTTPTSTTTSTTSPTSTTTSSTTTTTLLTTTSTTTPTSTSTTTPTTTSTTTTTSTMSSTTSPTSTTSSTTTSTTPSTTTMTTTTTSTTPSITSSPSTTSSTTAEATSSSTTSTMSTTSTISSTTTELPKTSTSTEITITTSSSEITTTSVTNTPSSSSTWTSTPMSSTVSTEKLLTSASQSTLSPLTPTSDLPTVAVSEGVQSSSSSIQAFSSTMTSTTDEVASSTTSHSLSTTPVFASTSSTDNKELSTTTAGASSSQALSSTTINGTVLPSTISSINRCTSNPCQHHSTCITRFGYYECICPSGYSGTNCENEINTCLSIPCQNGATCSHSFDFYSCKCKEKFTGYNCETEITICLSDPCANGGECLLVGGNRFMPPTAYRCDCAPGYKSALCEEVMTSCDDKPCRSGGSCNPAATRFTCACPSGFTGLYCETNIDDCPTLNPCNNGTCNDLINGFSCNCTPGYTGINCETEINECESSPCSTKDPKSTCLNLINQFACVCGPDFTGQLCRTGMNVVAQAENLVKPDGALSSVSAAGDDNNTLAVASTVSDALIFVAASLSVEERTSFSWTLNEMVDWCTYEGQECDMKGHFASFNDPTMGNCYTFNSVSSTRDFKAVQAGEKGGLSMMMKVNQSQYASWTDVAGIRVFLHDKRELVYPESVSITVTPGTASSAVIARSESLRLGQPYGNCTDSKTAVPSYYFTGPYMQEGCMRSCYQDNVQRVCGCMNPYYPIPSGKQACTLDSRKCVQKFDDDHADPNTWNCNCPMPCNQVDYLAGASRTDFRKNPTQCSTEQNATLRNDCIELYQHNRILIHVYYASIISIVFEEEELYPILKLLSDTGGNIGLLFGISAVTFIESAFTVILALYCGAMNVNL